MVFCNEIFAQANLQIPDSVIQQSASEPTIPDLYEKAVSLYEKGFYMKAEKYFEKDFFRNHNQHAGVYLYYAKKMQGRDMEADAFGKKYRPTDDFWKHKKGLENIYIDFGPRIAATTGLGNIYYGDAGAFFRLSTKTRLWQAFNYLQQDKNLGNFKQYESYTALRCYLDKGWYIAPSVHYAYTGYTSEISTNSSVETSDSFNAPGGFRKNINTQLENTNYNIPGTAHNINVSLGIVKRILSVSFEAEPSFHYSSSKSKASFNTVTANTTHSFLNGTLESVSVNTDSSKGTNNDTTVNSITTQLGAGLSWRLPLKKEPIVLRAMFYYLFNDNHRHALAFNFYSLVRVNNSFWLHFTYSYKGELPWVLNSEGQYFNATNKINARAGVSAQFFPLKKFSPLLTYQYEQKTRTFDNATLRYHSVYITLKYTL